MNTFLEANQDHYDMWIINERKSPTPLASKEAVRIIDNSHYIAHTEPICKVPRILKLEIFP